MLWAPNNGHVPRGFCGALGDPLSVRLVLVIAEPGDPHKHESHPLAPPEAILESAHNYAFQCYQSRKDQFHRNVRYFLDLCFPDRTFEEQMKVAWITESVLCSAESEGVSISKKCEVECRRRYLDSQLDQFPNAVVVALGNKAFRRLAGRNHIIKAFAAAPPGCNFVGAKESWQVAAAKGS